MGWKQQLTGVAVAASLAMMGGTAAAQSQASGAQGSGQYGQSATGAHGQDAPGQASHQASKNDVDKFYKKAAMGNVAGIELARLGAQKAENPQVKQFAEQMVDAHQRSLDQLKETASGNVEWPTTPGEKHQKLQDKLSGLSGEEFDREFMDAIVDAHESMEDLLENYVGEDRASAPDPGATATGTSGTTRPGSATVAPRLSGAASDWASRTLQEVRSHLEQAKDLKDQVKK